MLRPYFREWFKKTFGGRFTYPQKFSIPLIKKERNVLITSPTGSGKTLACFTAILDELFKKAEKGELEDKVYCVYISPLRALNNDIRRNLEVPLRETRKIAEEMGYELQEIRIGVRTGDTKPSEKQKQLIKPPHILVTTPETLAIILGTRKFKEKLKDVKWVIVDEIHELANSKRGVHLTLSLERLENFVGKRIIRIGAGATLEPLDEAAKFLVGMKTSGKPRDCWIVDARFVKPFDIKVLVPSKDLVFEDTDAINKKMYKLIDNLVSKHRTTLIFTNTRSGAERVHYHLKQLFPSKYLDEITGVHHSSVSRDIRFEVEEKLKSGKLKVVISSTSLELGIDIGYIDLVIQIGSPKSVSRLMQRIGRAGHRLHEVSKGRIIVLDRDDLVECSVMAKKCYEYWLDKFHMPKNCLDVLAQHLVGMAIEKKWNVEEAYRLVKKAYPYSTLKFEDFLKVLRYLAGRFHTLEDYNVYGKIWFDEEEMVFGRRGKYARVIYTLNLGTIPDEVKIKVRTLKGKFVGFLEEAFLERLMPGDIFVLGGKTYEFVKSKRNTAYVKEAKEKRPTIPSWFSEQLPLSYDLALEISKFREKVLKLMDKKPKKEAVKFLRKNLLVRRDVAEVIYEYFKLEHSYLKKFNAKYPSDKRILVENVVGSNEQMIIFHTLFGRRVNDALSRVYAYVLTKKLGRGVSVSISDNGFVLRIPFEAEKRKFGWIKISEMRKVREIDPKEIIKSVSSKSFEKLLKKALFNTELLKRKFRHVAARSFMILRNYKGHEISVEKQQMNAERLLRVVKKIKDFPILEETFREIMEDFMDVKHAKEILEGVEKGRIKFEILPKTKVPSPFSHNLIAISESDVVLMEDKKKLLVELHRKLMEELKK